MMISSGLSPKVVSQRLGHATVAITLDTYSHVLPAHDQAAADFIGQLLDVPLDRLPDIVRPRCDHGNRLPGVAWSAWCFPWDSNPEPMD